MMKSRDVPFAQERELLTLWRSPGGLRGNGDRIHRHDSLRDALFSAAQFAALAPRKEVPSLVPGTSSRPADVYLPNWCRGRPAALDVTVISTLQSLTLAGAASTQGHALRVGEERKMAAHNEVCWSVGGGVYSTCCGIPGRLE